MNRQLRVSLVQTNPVWESPRENSLGFKKRIEKSGQSDLILFPETTLTGFTMKSKEFCEGPGGVSESFFSEIASLSGALVCGGWIEKNPKGKPFNTFTAVDPNGRILARYRKIHPFTYGEESRHYSGGDSRIQFEWKGIRFGPAICFDLRFPELFRYRENAPEVFLVIANWPSERKDHWKILLQARAIENQAFVLGVNRWGEAGKHKSLPHSGHTAIVSPWGEAIYAGEGDSILEYTLDLDEVVSIRKKYPFLDDIRLVQNESVQIQDLNH